MSGIDKICQRCSNSLLLIILNTQRIFFFVTNVISRVREVVPREKWLVNGNIQ